MCSLYDEMKTGAYTTFKIVPTRRSYLMDCQQSILKFYIISSQYLFFLLRVYVYSTKLLSFVFEDDVCGCF
jgi:hypothetical protein